MKKLSDVYGLKIYNEDSEYVGVANDVLIDPDEGVIKFLLKGEIGSILRREEKEARRFLKENFIPFERVKAIGNIIIVAGVSK